MHTVLGHALRECHSPHWHALHRHVHGGYDDDEWSEWPVRIDTVHPLRPDFVPVKHVKSIQKEAETDTHHIHFADRVKMSVKRSRPGTYDADVTHELHDESIVNPVCIDVYPLSETMDKPGLIEALVTMGRLQQQWPHDENAHYPAPFLLGTWVNKQKKELMTITTDETWYFRDIQPGEEDDEQGKAYLLHPLLRALHIMQTRCGFAFFNSGPDNVMRNTDGVHRGIMFKNLCNTTPIVDGDVYQNALALWRIDPAHEMVRNIMPFTTSLTTVGMATQGMVLRRRTRGDRAKAKKIEESDEEVIRSIHTALEKFGASDESKGHVVHEFPYASDAALTSLFDVLLSPNKHEREYSYIMRASHTCYDRSFDQAMFYSVPLLAGDESSRVYVLVDLELIDYDTSYVDDEEVISVETSFSGVSQLAVLTIKGIETFMYKNIPIRTLLRDCCATDYDYMSEAQRYGVHLTLQPHLMAWRVQIGGRCYAAPVVPSAFTEMKYPDRSASMPPLDMSPDGEMVRQISLRFGTTQYEQEIPKKAIARFKPFETLADARWAWNAHPWRAIDGLAPGFLPRIGSEFYNSEATEQQKREIQYVRRCFRFVEPVGWVIAHKLWKVDSDDETLVFTNDHHCTFVRVRDRSDAESADDFFYDTSEEKLEHIDDHLNPWSEEDAHIIEWRQKQQWTKVDAMMHYRDHLSKLILQQFDEKVSENRLAGRVVITWSDRQDFGGAITLSDAGGCEAFKRVTRFSSDVVHKYRFCRITINTRYAKTIYRLEDTLAHELCHACRHIIDHGSGASNGDSGHDERFFEWGAKVTKHFPRLIITACHRYEETYRYLVACHFCGIVIGKHTLPTSKTCVHCDSSEHVKIVDAGPWGGWSPVRFAVREARVHGDYVYVWKLQSESRYHWDRRFPNELVYPAGAPGTILHGLLPPILVDDPQMFADRYRVLPPGHPVI